MTVMWTICSVEVRLGHRYTVLLKERKANTNIKLTLYLGFTVRNSWQQDFQKVNPLKWTWNNVLSHTHSYSTCAKPARALLCKSSSRAQGQDGSAAECVVLGRTVEFNVGRVRWSINDVYQRCGEGWGRHLCYVFANPGLGHILSKLCTRCNCSI